MGIALGVRNLRREELRREFDRICRTFAATRPTAVNLFWAIERMRRVYADNQTLATSRRFRMVLEREARAIHDRRISRRIAPSALHATPVDRGTVTSILTHCNAGALATAGYGTAARVRPRLGRGGKAHYRLLHETRPFLQGARLTACGAQEGSHSATLLTDSMVGHFMKQGAIDLRRRRHRTARRDTATLQTRSARIRSPFLRIVTHSLLRRAADLLDRPQLPARRQDSHRGARQPRGDAHLRSADRAVRHQDRGTGVRRDAARFGHRDHHRARHRAAAVLAELPRLVKVKRSRPHRAAREVGCEAANLNADRSAPLGRSFSRW